MHVQLYKKVLLDFKTFTKWMKDVSTNNVNLVGGINIGRCVDMVLIDILDGMHVHGIEEHVPSRYTLPSNNWFHSLFKFLGYVLFDNGCAFV